MPKLCCLELSNREPFDLPASRGDNGRWQFNYSSVGGDLASGALSNLYYPHSNRGAGLAFDNALITTGGRIANALAQEFILRRFTTKAKSPN